MPSFFDPKIRVGGLIQTGGLLVVLATLFGFAGRYHWFLDLFAHFRAQYVVLLVLVAAFHLLGRKTRPAALFLLFAVWNGSLLLPLYASRPKGSPTGACPLRVLSLNVHTESRAYDDVTSCVRDEHPDVAIFLEVSAEWMNHLVALTNDLPFVISEPRGDNFGIALLSRKPWLRVDIKHVGEAEVPSVVADYHICGRTLTLVGTHPVPPVGAEGFRLRNGQLDEIANLAKRVTNDVIVAGDLNVTPWSYWFTRFVSRSGLRDSAPGFGVRPTWLGVSILFGIPIDHCLVSDDVIIVDRRIGRDVGSDHRSLIIDLAVAPPEKSSKD